MSQPLKVGAEIPEFKAKDMNGNPITKDDLLGAPFIVYFYPKDDTPGCTKEACEFRDLMEGFDDMNVAVVGVSPDTPNSHQKFIDKYELNFPLISDEKWELAQKFGVTKNNPSGGNSIVRTTFLCNDTGEVLWVESPVQVEGHAQRVINAIQDILE